MTNFPLSRRAVVAGAVTSAAAGAAATLFPSSAQAQSANEGTTGFPTTGYFTVPRRARTDDNGIIAVLIGLLLPAVERPKLPARLQFADSAGKTYAMPIVTPAGQNGNIAAFFDVVFGDGSVMPGDGSVVPGDGSVKPGDGSVKPGDGSVKPGDGSVLIVRERGTNNTLFIPSPDGVLIALLLPAVQRNGEAAGLLAGSAQILAGDGSVRTLLPFIEQGNVYNARSRGGGGVSFVGPFTLADNESTAIGLLLPAVQKVREAAARGVQPHRLVLLNSAAELVAIAPMETPAGRVGSPAFSAFVDVALAGDGSVRIARRFVPGDGSVKPGDGSVKPGDGSVKPGDGSVRIVGAPQPDGILIGLLLPAVQQNGQTTGMLGGSLEMPGATVGFTEVSGLNL